jgi:tRNA modification GTPase
MIVVVHDFSTDVRDAMKIVDEIVSTHPQKHVVLVCNKCDVAGAESVGSGGSSEVSNIVPVISLSAKTGHNVGTLREYICRAARSGSDTATDVLLNDRHMYLLQQTQTSLSSARAALDADAFPEAIAYELRRAVDTLGEFTGEVINEDIINAVFAGFCIGK